MSADAAKYLWDALRAAEKIARFTAGHAFAEYLSDELLRSGVERPFEIIGEALGELRHADASLASRIPGLPLLLTTLRRMLPNPDL